MPRTWYYSTIITCLPSYHHGTFFVCLFVFVTPAKKTSRIPTVSDFRPKTTGMPAVEPRGFAARCGQGLRAHPAPAP